MLHQLTRLQNYSDAKSAVNQLLRLQGHEMLGRALRTAFCEAKHHIYLTCPLSTNAA